MPRGVYLRTPAPERFFTKVNFTETCWLWQGARTGRGYGAFGSKAAVAHRWAYEFCVSPIPLGLTIDHLCRVRHCVNPDHLEPVTTRLNILRGDGPSAANYRKTTCIRGHPLIGPNVHITPGGRRRCRLCQHDRVRTLTPAVLI